MPPPYGVGLCAPSLALSGIVLELDLVGTGNGGAEAVAGGACDRKARTPRSLQMSCGSTRYKRGFPDIRLLRAVGPLRSRVRRLRIWLSFD
jgi:hypothetical protein